MRYIDVRRLNIDEDTDWTAKAKEALEKVRAAEPEERSALIDGYEKIWKDLKVRLKTLSHEKCWYCESIDGRSDNSVDHYRPKGKVRGSKPAHGGYWWLAFDWNNYRFSCTYCNSPREGGGKHDYFPLRKEERRARCEKNPIDDEEPLLLDPVSPLDVKLIAFSDDGRAGPAVSAGERVEHMKGVVSIKRYNLNQTILVEMRLATFRQVREWVKEADGQLERYESEEAAQYLASARKRLQDIVRAIADDAPYSSAVRHYLAGLKAISRAASAALV